VPYNIRVGYFFNYNQTFAIELSYDPVKYHIVNGQNVRMTGMLDSRTIDSSFTFSDSTGHFYNLDGANVLSVNLVKRFQLFHPHSKVIRIDALAKVGIGPVMPHVYNSIRSKVAEYPSFQLAGWNAGAEAALRLTILRHLFLEGAYKYSYANYTDIGVYNGTATQKVITSQVVLSVGYAFSTTKRNPLFTKPEKVVIPFAIRPVFPNAPTPAGEDSKAEKPKKEDMPAEETKPSPAPDAPSPVPDAPSPTPETPSPAPDAPSPAPETPTPDAPPPAPEEPKN
jgi:opacity protein-like surface antigen